MECAYTFVEGTMETNIMNIGKYVRKMIAHVMDALEKLPTGCRYHKPLRRRKIKWIKIEDELPSDDEYVLVYSYHGQYFIENMISIGMREYNSWYDRDDYYSYHKDGEGPENGVLWKVTHWMPLPQVPEEKKDE